jgi:hypothetical protein
LKKTRAWRSTYANRLGGAQQILPSAWHSVVPVAAQRLNSTLAYY